ncbi:MAG: hypothetical protein IH892_15960 [Planctomycetes bacterium]|nr:hypothetical protein [Planctomycetota bacterium]
MKSEHRHELKTNELAEWMSNFPTWAKENAMVLIPTVVVLAGIGFYYFFWSQGSARADEQNRADFTDALSRLLQVKNRVAAESSGADDMPLLLTVTADNLAIVAASSTSDGMAAFALIKRAEALRSAVFFQTRQTPEDLALQIEAIKDAQASYSEAQAKAVNHKTLLASATYGLGLCAEELRHFDEAKQIYRVMISDPNLQGTAAQASAEYRLKTLHHYRSEIVFNEAPAEVNLAPVTISLDGTPSEIVFDETPEEVNLAPVTISLDGTPLTDTNTPALGPALEPAAPEPVPVADTNTTE